MFWPCACVMFNSSQLNNPNNPDNSYDNPDNPDVYLALD